MACSHGLKTDGRKHVFNKLSYCNLTVAQGVKPLCFCFILMLAFMPVAAAADEVLSRIKRIENELDTLNRAVYKGEREDSMPTPLYQAPSAENAKANAQNELRLQQVEQEVRTLTGHIEKQQYTIDQLRAQIQKMQQADAIEQAKKDTAPQKVEAKKMSPAVLVQPPEVSGIKTITPAATSSGDATLQYETSFGYLKQQEYQKAQEGFEGFLVSHSDHVLAANAKYWMGETFYVRGDYKQAARVFAEGFQQYPDSAKTPDMLLKLGLSLSGMNNRDDACVALKQLPIKFPSAPSQIIERAQGEFSRLNCEL